MKTIKVNTTKDIPKKYTGIIEWDDGTKWWFKNGGFHCENGPIVKRGDGSKIYYLKGVYFEENVYWFLVLTFIKNKKKIPEIYFK